MSGEIPIFMSSDRSESGVAELKGEAARTLWFSKPDEALVLPVSFDDGHRKAFRIVFALEETRSGFFFYLSPDMRCELRRAEGQCTLFLEMRAGGNNRAHRWERSGLADDLAVVEAELSDVVAWVFLQMAPRGQIVPQGVPVRRVRR